MGVMNNSSFKRYSSAIEKAGLDDRYRYCNDAIDAVLSVAVKVILEGALDTIRSPTICVSVFDACIPLHA